MKTAKLVIGVLSIVLTMVVLFQSCAATVGDALANEGGTSGGVGMAVALLMLVAGIVAIAARIVAEAAYSASLLMLWQAFWD